jgi:hypothetical protein
MLKTNVDPHYNHKLNQYANMLLFEVNKFLHDSLFFHLPADDSIVLSIGCTKSRVDGKAAVPVGEPGFPVCTGVWKVSAC